MFCANYDLHKSRDTAPACIGHENSCPRPMARERLFLQGELLDHEGWDGGAQAPICGALQIAVDVLVVDWGVVLLLLPLSGLFQDLAAAADDGLIHCLRLDGGTPHIQEADVERVRDSDGHVALVHTGSAGEELIQAAGALLQHGLGDGELLVKKVLGLAPEKVPDTVFEVFEHGCLFFVDKCLDAFHVQLDTGAEAFV